MCECFELKYSQLKYTTTVDFQLIKMQALQIQCIKMQEGVKAMHFFSSKLVNSTSFLFSKTFVIILLPYYLS